MYSNDYKWMLLSFAYVPLLPENFPCNPLGSTKDRPDSPPNMQGPKVGTV